jgi:hypothetical protein
VDLVYTCRSGDNEELRYSIRSAVKNFKHDNIWVVGYKPDWFVGNFVSVPDIGQKFDNIVNCIKEISQIEQISDDFILMNDDFFFLQPMDYLETYHGGSLLKKTNEYLSMGARKYGTLLNRTHRSLLRLGIKDPLDYDIHVPMPMNKEKLRLSLNKAYFPRSAYGNVNNVGGKLITDVKTYGRRSSMASRSYNFSKGNMPFISTEDSSFQDVYETILRDMFPTPTKYEAT